MKYLFTLLILLHLSLFASINGKVIDIKTSLPICGATVSDKYSDAMSDSDGMFSIKSNQETFHVKAPGYRRLSISKNTKNTIIKLEPIKVKALYLSFWGASMKSKTIKRILKIIEETEINTIVVDVKNEYGSTSYKTAFEEANIYGAHKQRTNRCIDKFIELMKSKNIYTIARIVTFKDELQAKNNTDYAIKNPDGTLWRNKDDMAWVDPFDERSHAYTLSIAEDAAQMGFDEINFDYIRFPARKGLLLSKENTQENRIEAIETFLKSARNVLRPYGVFVSVDTYGNICWAKDDTGIGQKVESLSKYSDYISPMLYPSGFATGSFNYKNPSEHPYNVIFRSLRNIEHTIDSKKVRPWLQYFKDYAHSKNRYKKFEIKEQIRAADDTNTSGWMMWSPSSRYHMNYFNPIN